MTALNKQIDERKEFNKIKIDAKVETSNKIEFISHNYKKKEMKNFNLKT